MSSSTPTEERSPISSGGPSLPPPSGAESKTQRRGQLPAWSQWLLGIGVALAGGIVGAWPNVWMSLAPVLFFIGMGSLLGGALLRSWWALIAVPAAAVGGMVLINLAYTLVMEGPEAITFPGDVDIFIILGLLPALVTTPIGIALGQFIVSRRQHGMIG